MSGVGEALCEGWLRKSPPEKKLRRYAWKRRWFVLRSGRLTGDPDVLQYYKHNHARQPIRTINLNLCEQVDAGLSFTKKELESSFVFDLRTEGRTWYLVAESEEDMNRWVSSICLLCGFNPTQDEKLPVSAPSPVTAMTGASHTPISMVAGLVPPPYSLVSVQHFEPSRGPEEDYLWLNQCQSHTRPAVGSSFSSDIEYNLPSSSSSSSSASSPSLLSNGLLPLPSSQTSSGCGTAPWMVGMTAAHLSQAPGVDVTSDPQRGRGQPRCQLSPHPRKHSLDLHLQPVKICPDECCTQTYTHTHTVLNTHTLQLAAPPRPPKTQLPRPGTEQEQRDRWLMGGEERGGGGKEGGGGMQGNTETEHAGCDRSLSDRASMFEFSQSFNSYFINKGLVPLGSVCSEDDDVDENYVPMSAATTEPPLATHSSPPTLLLPDSNYVSMTPLPASPAPHPGHLGSQVPPPVHMGFRSTPPNPLSSPLTPPLRRLPASSTRPPPVHRNLKPQQQVKPTPTDVNPPQDWEEVPPPIHSPVTRTFTRDPSRHPSIMPSSTSSSSPSSDSDDPDDNYVAMTTSSLTAEPPLRMMVHRMSDGGFSSPLLWRARRDKQVEYLDLDLNTGQAIPPRHRNCTGEGGVGSERGGRVGEQHARVEYVVVDPERTRALRNTKEAWHDGRLSSEKF